MPLMCRGRYTPSRRAMAAPTQDDAKQVNHLQIHFQNIERTKRVPYNCHSSGAMSSDSILNSWEDIRRCPWSTDQVSTIPNESDIFAYLACSLAKPWWASTERLTPGKKVESSGPKDALRSVASASLHTHQKKLSALSLLKLLRNIEQTYQRAQSLDELRWPFPVMARSQRTLHHK